MLHILEANSLSSHSTYGMSYGTEAAMEMGSQLTDLWR
jgi:hypothetical protein